MALTAQKFGCRPSSLAGIEDPVVAYALDEALAVRLAANEAEARERRGKGTIPTGQQYESWQDAISEGRVN